MTTVIVTLDATGTSARIDGDRLAVHPDVFARICRESYPALGVQSCELHITTGGDDDDALDALDDLLRDRARAVEEFVGTDCFVLFRRRGIRGCDVWARCRVENA